MDTGPSSVRSVAGQHHILLRAALVRSAAGGPVKHIPGWLHPPLRVQPVEQVMEGLCIHEPPLVPPDQAWIDVKRLRHLPWGSHHDKTCEALGRIASRAKDAVVPSEPAAKTKIKRLAARCARLRSPIGSDESALIGYGERRRAGKPVSTSRAEGTVNQTVSARMNKRRQMRWSPRGTHRPLQVRAAVLDGQLGHPAIQPAPQRPRFLTLLISVLRPSPEPILLASAG